MTEQQIHIIGIDLGKNWFHVAAMSERGEPIYRKKLSRNQLAEFIPTWVIAARRSAGVGTSGSAPLASRPPLPRLAGVTGANTPWNRIRFTRGFGTRAASRAMKSRGCSMRDVWTTDYGAPSSYTSPAAPGLPLKCSIRRSRGTSHKRSRLTSKA